MVGRKGVNDMADGPDEYGVCVTATQWAEICEKARFHCKECKEVPDLSDLDIFLEDGICGDCARRNRRIYQE